MLANDAPAWMTWRWRDAHRNRRAAGSMPLLGSSMSTTGGAPTSATATLSLRRLPPEYVSHTLRSRDPISTQDVDTIVDMLRQLSIAVSKQCKLRCRTSVAHR